NRIEVYLKYHIKKIKYEKGQTNVVKKDFIHKTNLALNHNAKPSEIVADEELENSLICSEEKFVVNEGDYMYPTFLYKHEDELARKLSKMKGALLGRGMPNFKNHIKTYQKRQGIVLAEKQRQASVKLFEKQLLVLTCGPGT